MDEDGHPRALKPERRRHENDCNTGLASKAHRFLSLLFARAAPLFLRSIRCSSPRLLLRPRVDSAGYQVFLKLLNRNGDALAVKCQTVVTDTRTF